MRHRTGLQAELPRRRRAAGRLPHALLAASIATGCGSLLGLDEAPATSECIRNEDCALGFECREFRCLELGNSDAGQPNGGDNGAGNGGTTGGSAAQAGTAPHLNGGSPATGGGGGGGDDDQGGRGGTGGKGGTGGQGGRGGNGPQAGDGGAGDTSAQGGGGDGGEGAEGGETSDCDGSLCLKCDQGRFVAGTHCAHACSEANECIVPKSCNGLLTTCGSNVSCCLSYPVFGGTFSRSCDDYCDDCGEGPYPASLTTFSLDAFEVTVGRFRRFVAEYPAARPAIGDGNNRHNVNDEGWRSEWDAHLPATVEELTAELDAENCGLPRTWTTVEQDNESKPISCVSWYLAQAFCVWDGGRLPTQTEWTYAATGGGEDRLYPWSVPHDSPVIDSNYAVYESDSPLYEQDRVGRHAAGAGKWLQQDLSGNVMEWVLDDFQGCLPTPDRCDDCGIASATATQKSVMGGGFWDLPSDVTATSRTGGEAAVGYSDFGFRCARDP